MNHEIKYILGLKEGDFSSFDKLFELYHKRIFCFARALLKNKEDAEEIVQDVFVRVWQKRQDIKEHLNFKSFIFTITYNLVVDRFRDRIKDEKIREALANETIESTFNVEQDIDYTQLNDMVRETIEALPPQQKTVYKMSRTYGLTHREIAIRLNISVNTVKNHVANALKEIKNVLSQRSLMGILFYFLFIR